MQIISNTALKELFKIINKSIINIASKGIKTLRIWHNTHFHLLRNRCSEHWKKVRGKKGKNA